MSRHVKAKIAIYIWVVSQSQPAIFSHKNLKGSPEPNGATNPAKQPEKNIISDGLKITQDSQDYQSSHPQD